MKTIKIKRTQIELYPDSKRVLLRPFHVMSGQRASEICAHILALPEDQVETLLRQLWAEFGERHKNIRGYFRSRFEEARPYLLSDLVISEERALLIGGYFTHDIPTRPRHCSIPRWCHTRTSRTWLEGRGVSS